MREIKYRVWDTEEKCFMEHSRVIESRLLDLEKNGEGRFVFQQWTGILNIQGAEIYEGDIVKNPFGEEYKIIWDEKRCQFIALTTNEDGSEWYQHMSRSFEIIGNIYEGKNSTK